MSILNVDSDNPKLFDLKVDEKPTFIIVKAEWCGHCKRFKSTWEDLEKEYNNKYNFIAYDADNDKEKIEKYNIQGFPTIKFKKGDKIVEYQGSRDIESLSSMIESL